MTLSRDTSYNLVGALAPVFLTLAVTPLYLRLIGPDRFGLLAICWTLLGALNFASLGMGPALAYWLARSHDASPLSRSRLVWTALFLAVAASIAGAFLVLAIGQFYFRNFASAPSMLSGEILGALPLLAAVFPIGILTGVLNGALQGLGRFRALTVISLVNSTLVSLLPLSVALLIGAHLAELIAASLIALTISCCAELLICAELVPLNRPATDQADAKKLLTYGAWMSGTALLIPFVLLLDRFVIGALAGAAAVAVYVLPYNLVQRMILIPASLSSAVMPRFAASASDQDVQQLQSRSLAWLNGLLSPMAIMGIAVAAPFFRFWIGPALGGAAGPVAAILIVGGWVHGIGHIPSTIAAGRNRPDLVTKLLLVYLVPYVALLYFATDRYGIIGAASAWTIRAAFDPVLFLFTGPRRSDMLFVAASATLVVAAMVVALALPWTSLLYWVLLAIIAAAACYQNRVVLISSAARMRTLAFGTA